MIRKIINTLFTNTTAAIINLCIAIVVSRYLGASGKGEQSIILASITIILLICNIIGGGSLVYLTPRHSLKNILLPSYSWSFLICIIVFLTFYFFPIINNTYSVHICILTLIHSLGSINQMILVGRKKIAYRNMINLTQVFLIISSLLFFFHISEFQNVMAYIYALYIGFGSCFIISIILVLVRPKATTSSFPSLKSSIIDLWRYGFLNQLSHISIILSFRISYYMLFYTFGEESVGIYSNAVSIAEAVWLITRSINLVQYSEIANISDKVYAQKLTLSLTKISFIISVIIVIPLALLPGSFYSMIFGEEFSQISIVIRILASGIALYNYSLIPGHYFSGIGKFIILTKASAITLISTIFFTLILIPKFHIIGAATSALLAYIANTIYIAWFFKNEAGLKFVELLPSLNDFQNYKNSLFNHYKQKPTNIS